MRDDHALALLDLLGEPRVALTARVRLDRLALVLLVIAACSNDSPGQCDADTHLMIADLVHARYRALSRDCTNDSECGAGVVLFSTITEHACFVECDLAIAASSADVWNDFVTNPAIQTLCDRVQSDSCDLACPLYSGMCLDGQCTVPRDVDTAVCNDKISAVYQALNAYVQSLNAVCADNSECTSLTYGDIHTCGFECGTVVPTAHAQDIVDFITTIAEICQSAHDAGCLAERGSALCPYEPPTCDQGQCVGGF